MGTDFAASLSGSSSATAGQSFDFRNAFGGDFIVGGKKPVPPWVWLVAGGLLLAGAVVYLVRK